MAQFEDVMDQFGDVVAQFEDVGVAQFEDV
jgi:hypothetical protein